MKKICFAIVVTFLFINGAYAQVNASTRQMVQSNCMPDIKKFCADVQPGGGRILDCLMGHKADLSDNCMSALKTAKQEQQ